MTPSDAPSSPAPSDQGSGSARGFATMADVAAMAGVSQKSVSRVINNEPHISAKLRARVETAIAALDYVPDMAARSLAGARSFTLGVLFDNPSPNYTMAIVSGAYAACIGAKHHLRIDMVDSAAPGDGLATQLDQILRHSRVDGLLLTPPITDNPAVLDYLEARRVPFVRITPVLDPDRSSMVWMDNIAAGAAVADYLWSLGHRRFGIATGPANHGDAGQRRAGFVGRLQELKPDINVSEAYGGYQFDVGIEAGRELLAAKRYPTAIFATNDDSAAGIMVAARELGLSVPDDVSICGFDDSWVAKSVSPYLTTICQPIRDMAQAAANILLDRRNAGTKHFQQLDFTLIERGSTSPAR
jgi:LacI family transcriptional regulator